MKLKISMTYDNISNEWLEWYLKRLSNEEVLPGSTKIIEDLKEYGHASFSSKDPTSSAVATTEYLIVKGD